jgi:hypothetical protein
VVQEALEGSEAVTEVPVEPVPACRHLRALPATLSAPAAAAAQPRATSGKNGTEPSTPRRSRAAQLWPTHIRVPRTLDPQPKERVQCSWQLRFAHAPAFRSTKYLDTRAGVPALERARERRTSLQI